MVASKFASGSWTLALGVLAAIPSCHRSSTAEGAPSSASITAVASNEPPVAHTERFPVPTGPLLAILAGQGLGPIRFGATRATIERLMEAPCDIASETMCRYIPRAIEFTLDKGVVSKIRVHRIGRSAGLDKSGKPATYGAFNGAIPPD